MKNLFLTITLLGLFMGCLMEEKDCTDDDGCGDDKTIAQPLDSMVVDGVVMYGFNTGCGESLIPVCAGGLNFYNSCEALAGGYQDFQLGTCDNPQEHEVVCSAKLLVEPECGADEQAVFTSVYLNESQIDSDVSNCQGGYKCIPIVECKELADPSMMDCQEGSEPRLVRDEAGCSDYQCVDSHKDDSQCLDYWVEEHPDDISVTIKKPDDIHTLPVDETCEPIFDDNGCIVDYHCTH